MKKRTILLILAGMAILATLDGCKDKPEVEPVTPCKEDTLAIVIDSIYTATQNGYVEVQLFASCYSLILYKNEIYQTSGHQRERIDVKKGDTFRYFTSCDTVVYAKYFMTCENN